MIIKIFTIFDQKAEAYLAPFFLNTKGQAIRAFSDSINDPSHQFNHHPEDYTLFQLGEYDDSAASIDTLPSPISLGVAIEYIKEAPAQPIFLE